MYSIQQKLMLFLLLPFVCLACSKETEGEKPATQIAAKVNSGEISVHQINYVLSRMNAATQLPENAAKVRQGILDRLIDQELVLEQALEKKLDRSPEVLMAVENARREILARAYIEQITAALPKPTTEEVKAYYAKHPQLFAERRIYNIQEIAIPASAGVTGELRELLNGGKSLEEIANWLKSKDVKFSGGSATRPAEQIPLELLPKIHPLKVGQGLMVEGPQSVTVMRLAAAQSAPVSEEIALPRIQQFLGNQRATEAAKEEIKALKANAKITYMGEFANASTDNAELKGAPPIPNTNADGSDASAATRTSDDVILSKGVSGLK